MGQLRKRVRHCMDDPTGSISVAERGDGMRLIDAEGSELQTQLKIIREAEYQIYGSGSWGFTAKCEHAIEDAPTVQPEPHWIPVEQELPEEDTDVLVTVHFLGLKKTHPNGWNGHIKESYYVEVASHICGEWSSASDDYKIARDRHKVIAWCELPEPYKGVTE